MCYLDPLSEQTKAASHDDTYEDAIAYEEFQMICDEYEAAMQEYNEKRKALYAELSQRDIKEREEFGYSGLDIGYSPGGRSGLDTPASSTLNSFEPHPMVAEAWESLRRSLVYFRGQPVGTIAAYDHASEEVLNYDQGREAVYAKQKAPPNQRDIREVLREDFKLGTEDIDKLLLKICIGPTELYEAWKCRICEEVRRYSYVRKCPKIIYREICVRSVLKIEHPSAYAQLYFMHTTLRARRQTVTKEWYMDSQATMHACDSKEKFLTYTPGSGGIHVVAANNTQADVAGIGTVLLRSTSGESVILKDVLHVPTINKCLISVSKLNEDEFGKAGRYADARKCEKIKSGQTGVNSVYVIEHLSASAQVSFTDTTMSAERPFVFQDWYMDSGAAIHVCDSQAKFLEYTPGNGGQEVVVANSARADVAGIGTVLLRLSSGESVVLKGVLHVPTVNKCLISVSKLIEDGFKVAFEGPNVVMSKNDKVIGDGYVERGMYRMNINNDPTGASTSGTVSEARQGSFSFLEKMFSYFKLRRQFYS